MNASTRVTRPRISCLSCGVEFEQTRPWSRYCSPGCRRRDYEKREGLPSSGSKDIERGRAVESKAGDSVPSFTTRDGRPHSQLRPCPVCGNRKFAWPIGSDTFACVTCEPPSSTGVVAAFLIAP